MNKEGLVTADSKGDGNWGDDDPYVFIITNDGGLRGEYQVSSNKWLWPS